LVRKRCGSKGGSSWATSVLLLNFLVLDRNQWVRSALGSCFCLSDLPGWESFGFADFFSSIFDIAGVWVVCLAA